MFSRNRTGNRPVRRVARSRGAKPAGNRSQSSVSHGTISSNNDNLSKPVVNIFLNRRSASTQILSQHLAKNIDSLNKLLLINFIYITQKNAQIVMQKGIKRTPTLIYGKRRFEGIEKIVQILTPPEKERETYGYGVTSPEEMLHTWQNMIIDTRDDDEVDEGDPDVRTNQIRSKMAAFQKNRPKMEGVGRKNKIRGGRKVTAKNDQRDYGDYMERDGDTQFMRDAGLFDVEDTPVAGYTENKDGELMLEEYYLNLALEGGKEDRRGRVAIPKR